MKNQDTQRRRWVWFSHLACIVTAVVFICSAAFAAAPTYVPGGSLDPTIVPKYVTPLVIPPVMPKSTASPAPAADYDIAVRQFQQQILPGGLWGSSFPNPTVGGGPAVGPMPATTVWSYGRQEDALPGGFIAPVPVGNPGYSFNYPAFTVENTSNVATTVRWINDLVDPATGNYRSHLFSVDQTLHWANPPMANCVMGNPNRTDCETDIAAPYTGPVPLVTHVHGAHVQPHSDGYPEAWWLPGAPGTKGIPASFAQRGTNFGQANNANTVTGSAYFSYENTQPAATIWYHDHALGMTRLNVYAGPAGFWLIRGGANGDAFVDDASTAGVPNDGVLPGPAPTIAGGDPNFVPAVRDTIREIPIVIQDRSFDLVNALGATVTDPTLAVEAKLFYPSSRTFFDGFTGPYIGGTGTPAGPSDMSGIWNPEAFFNTMVINGTTWPKFEVAQARYRLRLLNGCNSRSLNLSMFVVLGPGVDGIMGTADDDLGAVPQELPIYQIGGDQGFLPQVVMITKGFATPLPGNGTIPAAVPAVSTEQGLFLMSAERADVIVDFSALANGTRVRLFNTAPDSPFQGFPAGLVGYVPADPGTTGQVMDFIVNTTLTATASTAPENLVLPAAPLLGAATKTRQVSLNEMSSDQVCVEVRVLDGAIIKTLFSTYPGDPNFQTNCANATVAAGNFPTPAGPRQAQLGVLTLSGGNLVAAPKRWGDAITENPLLNSTEVWEIYNTTADGHPIHLHQVGFEVVNREDLDANALNLSGTLVPTGVTYPPRPNELGYKDTVLALPTQITRIKAKFDIAGLYVWHCHIVEHEDNEMMRPFVVSGDALYAEITGYGIWKWDGVAWTQLNSIDPAAMVASGSSLYASIDGYGIWKYDGTQWSQLNSINPASMVASGPALYASITGYGIWKWDGAAWSQLNTTNPTNMVASSSALYASITGNGIWKWDGAAWSQLSAVDPADMKASGSVLYAAFSGMGIWQWDGLAWSQLAPAVPENMVSSDSMLYADFGGFGIWKWDGASWSQLNTNNPANMVAAGSVLYADIPGNGIWKYDGSAWSQLNATSPAKMVAAGSTLFADITGSGIWKWDGSAWSQLNTNNPADMVSGL